MSKLSGADTLTKHINHGLKPIKNWLGATADATDFLSNTSLIGNTNTELSFMTVDDGSDLTLSGGTVMEVDS